MLGVTYDAVLMGFPFLVYKFIGLDRKKWVSWTKKKRFLFLFSWLVVSSVLVYADLSIFVLASIILFLIEIYL
ncbi:hypothetical protein BAU15_05995 [Enterococcus sp. JM4C]|nr:hypothetical protein BAU15_05995 [Enterococcus sp. JM4C]